MAVSGERGAEVPPAGGRFPAHLTRGILAIWAREGKWAEIGISGLSMMPLIPDGSRLTVRFGREGLAVGDVVLYATETHLIAHRVIRLGRGGRRWGWLRVKGDPLHAGEASWIPVEDVVGRVVSVVRPDGTRLLLNTGAGRLAGRLAAAVSGPLARIEGGILRRLGVPDLLPATRALLHLSGLVHGRSAEREMRGGRFLLGATQRFLIHAARLDVDASRHEAIGGMLRDDLPWERIVPAAARLGLAPVLYRNLSLDGLRGSVPRAALAELRRSAHGSALLMAIQMEGLARIDAAMRSGGIVPVLLKGAALAVTLYDQPALRPMHDIDLLVGPEEVERAVAILEGIGFRGIRSDRGPGFYATHHHTLPMIGPRGRLVVEVHRGIVPRSEGMSVDAGELLDRAVDVERGGKTWRVLSLPNQILHTALHLSHTDRFVGRLRDLMDIHALVVSTERVEWSVLIEASRSWAASRSLFATLDLGRRLLGTPIPSEVLSELARGARWDPLAAAAVRHLGRWSLFEGGEQGQLLSDPVLKTLCDAFLKRLRWSERMQLLAASLGPPSRIAV